MTDFLKCSACGAKVAVDPGDVNRILQCEKCGGFLSPQSSRWNPYDPPSASFGQGDDGKLLPLEVPESFFGKFGLAFRLLGENLLLYSLIMLTVWLPANIAFEYFLFNAPPGQELFVSFRMNSLLQGAFGPISIGALVFAIAKRMEGEKVGYLEVMKVGFQNWGRLFAANFFAGLLILIGYIAFIVPGIILSVRYSLLAPVVVLERSGSPTARSTELTAGRRWRIFSAELLFYSIFGAATYASGYVLEYLQEAVEWLDVFWFSVASDCCFNVIECVFTTLIVLYYLEARALNGLKRAETIGDFEIRTRMSEAF